LLEVLDVDDLGPMAGSAVAAALVVDCASLDGQVTGSHSEDPGGGNSMANFIDEAGICLWGRLVDTLSTQASGVIVVVVLEAEDPAKSRAIPELMTESLTVSGFT
jgi:hypothetical protein